MKTCPLKEVSLLAPARDLECGLEAIRHGADAVYIGAPRFSARAAAGCKVDEIARLCDFAHLYGARVYVALNTLLRDDQLAEAERIAWAAYHAGADALIIQDMGLTLLHLPPIALHASTQTDNRTPERVAFLAKAGFRQVVLARELSLEEIRRIHEACPGVRLEAFVHGALCVSYSGQCYASQACFGRSANRGECAQFCRLPFDLVDANGRTITRQRHLLSLRDLNRLDHLEELIDAGVTSLKIEGRLKDLTYVKNVTAAYRSRLDEILARRPDLRRASSGRSTFTFRPQVDRSFNRGFTDYFLHGRPEHYDIGSPASPKSIGEEMGRVKEQRGNSLTVAGVKPFHNGDGLCYIDRQGRLVGFRINRVEGNRLFPAGGAVPRIEPHTVVYRNFDQELERQLSVPSAERRIALRWLLTDTPWGFALSACDADGFHATLTFAHPKEEARRRQDESIRAQLSRLGDTPFEVTDIEVRLSAPWFLPASVLADWRRQVVARLVAVRRIRSRRPIAPWQQTTHPYPATQLDYTGNVTNALAARFYRQHGVDSIAPGYELQPVPGAVLMFCRHCLRHQMGWCPVYQHGHSPYTEPYSLVLSDGRRFRLEFDCKQCMMRIRQD